MTKEEVIADIVAECKARGLSMPEQIAYVLATVDHETARTFQPVREAFFLGNRAENYLKKKPYWPYYGRGYVMLTWRRNYDRIGVALGIPLSYEPDRALDHDVAKFALVYGMKNGLYGKPLTDFIKPGKVDFANARRSVNALDKSQHIATLARSYLRDL